MKNQDYELLEARFNELFRIHLESVEINKALLQEKERLDLTLRLIGEGVIIINNVRRVELINPAAEEITGLTSTDAVGRLVEEVLMVYNGQTGQTCPDMIDRALYNGEIIHWEINTVIHTEDKRKKYISVLCAPVKTEDGVVTKALLVFKTVNDRVMINDVLAWKTKIESLRIIAGGIAHDLNNILTTIIGSISLGMDASKGNTSYHGIFSEIEKASSRAKELTSQLMSFSKYGGSVKQATSIKNEIRYVSDLALIGSPVKKEYTIADDLWEIEAEKGQIGQVIYNLVLNAKQAVEDCGRIHIEARNHRASHGDDVLIGPGNYVHISVMDNGPGIDEKHMPYIFDSFFTTKSKSTGLGLALTSSIISNHNGHITVKSKPGEGTIFEIYIPALAPVMN